MLGDIANFIRQQHQKRSMQATWCFIQLHYLLKVVGKTWQMVQI